MLRAFSFPSWLPVAANRSCPLGRTLPSRQAQAAQVFFSLGRAKTESEDGHGVASGASSFATSANSVPAVALSAVSLSLSALMAVSLQLYHKEAGKCGVSWLRLDCSRRFGRQDGSSGTREEVAIGVFGQVTRTRDGNYERLRLGFAMLGIGCAA